MINDDKAREAAKFLKQYCHEHKSCYNCIFFRHDGVCSLMQHSVYFWEVDENGR